MIAANASKLIEGQVHRSVHVGSLSEKPLLLVLQRHFPGVFWVDLVVDEELEVIMPVALEEF